MAKEGREVLVEGSATRRVDQGQTITTRSPFRDVTAKKRAEQALRAKNEELEHALAEVQPLQGILPICIYCKKIRDDGDYWQEVESYVQRHTGAEFSHGVCPGCLELHWPGAHEELEPQEKA